MWQGLFSDIFFRPKTKAEKTKTLSLLKGGFLFAQRGRPTCDLASKGLFCPSKKIKIYLEKR
jgi:hypothetical protein